MIKNLKTSLKKNNDACLFESGENVAAAAAFFAAVESLEFRLVGKVFLKIVNNKKSSHKNVFL